MKRRTAINRLKSTSAAIKALGATALYLFGSTSTNKARKTSDVDLFIDYDPKQGFSLIHLVSIKDLLEETLETKVDLTTRNSLHPLLRKDIEKTAIRVF